MEDWQPERPDEVAARTLTTGGYTLGIHRNEAEREEGTPSGAEKFTQGRGANRRAEPSQRMAGQALDADIKQATDSRRSRTKACKCLS